MGMGVKWEWDLRVGRGLGMLMVSAFYVDS